MIPSVMRRGALTGLVASRPALRFWLTLVLSATVVVATILPAHAQSEGGGDPSKVGDLVGNLPGAVYLLIPLALVLALLTAVALGPGDESETTARRAGGISRALSRHEAGSPPP
jgi:lipopolysaccharide export LptBFGC system permease protein LptF